MAFGENLIWPVAGTGLLTALAALMVLWVIIGIGVYVFYSLAFMAIGKKARFQYPALAWIPVVGPLIITSQVAKMHWWPILLLAGAWIPIFGGILSLVVVVFSVIWLWKTFEVIGKPGWWAVLCLIPIVNLILLGIAAWGK